MTHDVNKSVRMQELLDWLGAETGETGLELNPVSADASFRRYFSVHTKSGKRVVMDAGAGQESCHKFVLVAGLLRDAGLNAPVIYAEDFSRGFMLLSNLGTQSYLEVLDQHNADDLFSDALNALLTWQLVSTPGVLPDYDNALLQDELDLWPDWYLGKHLGIELSASQRAEWDTACDLLKTSARNQPQVFVHRDYMPRNLLISNPNPGIIDFQDAVFGPISYDLVSLFRDAFISWDEQRIDAWLRQYHERAVASGLPVNPDISAFKREFDWMGVQRHLKVIGIFTRLNYRDNKPHYLGDIPRFLDYLHNILPRHPELSGLHALLKETASRGVSA